MLEFKVTPEQISLRIGAKNLAQICTETFMAIRTIYKRLSSEDAESYKKLVSENIETAFIDDAEIAARTEDKSKQLLDRLNSEIEALGKALNSEIEALEKAMDTNAN